MTTLAAQPIDPNQLDLLTAIADVTLTTADFRAACEADARSHEGWVNPNRVSALLHQRHGEFKPQWLSGQWAPACGPNGFLDKTNVEVPIDGKHSKGNGNKTVKLRRWRT